MFSCFVCQQSFRVILAVNTLPRRPVNLSIHWVSALAKTSETTSLSNNFSKLSVYINMSPFSMLLATISLMLNNCQLIWHNPFKTTLLFVATTMIAHLPWTVNLTVEQRRSKTGGTVLAVKLHVSWYALTIDDICCCCCTYSFCVFVTNQYIHCLTKAKFAYMTLVSE